MCFLWQDIVLTCELVTEGAEDRDVHDPIGSGFALTGTMFVLKLDQVEVLYFKEEPIKQNDVYLRVHKIAEEGLIIFTEVFGKSTEAQICLGFFPECLQFRALLRFQSGSRLGFPEDHFDFIFVLSPRHDGKIDLM